VQSEDVGLLFLFDRAQFHTGNHSHADGVACGTGLIHPGQCVVVRQCDRGQPGCLGRVRHVRWSARPVRRRRVRVQVDEWIVVIAAHGARGVRHDR